MSKFIDELNRLTHGETSPLGFRREQSAKPSRKLRLVASLPEESTGEVTGADAVLFNISGKDIDGESAQKISGDTPWGVRLRGGQKELKKLIEAGCDYIVFNTGTPLDIIENTGPGKVLEIDPATADSMLRGVNELPVDAVLVSTGQDEVKALTWQDLMLFQRFGDILRKPLIACAPANLTASELEALWEAGVLAVAVDVKTKDVINKIRKVIDNTEFAKTRKREKIEPVLRHTDDE